MKDQLVKIIRAEGYDFMSACEIASFFIGDLEHLTPGNYNFSIGETTIEIKKAA